MKNKLWFLTKQSLYKKVKTKWFVLANVLIFVALLAFGNMDKIITFFGGDFDQKQEIILVDNNTLELNNVISNITETGKLMGYEDRFDIKKQTDVKTDLTEEDQMIIIEFSKSETEFITAKVTSYESLSQMTNQIITTALNKTKNEYALNESNIDFNEVQRVMAPITIASDIKSLDSVDNEKKTEMFFNNIMPILIMPLFILTVFVIQMIGAEINEEKTSRSMEIIISNVSAGTHFTSKVLAANLFAIIQGALLMLYGVLTFVITALLTKSSGGLSSILDGVKPLLEQSGILADLWYIIPLVLGMSLLSILAYSLIAGVLASMTVNMEDYQQVQTPIMFIMMAGYYLAIFSVAFEGSSFIKVLSFVPLISSLLAPALLVAGQITILDAAISVIILVLFNYVIIKYGIRIYKIGILNYSSDKMWSRIFKAVKEK